ncbi:MAG: DNA integrity scanning protein DisA nucleotide-binding domain protein [Myxococcales bacterium]|nr:DNA integrity scanning protein DisA nucleotide-binding domain protein [Myxococcales bacterium]MCB9705831.1 DNA integrity scanning protein DisA nucleotide-binding domain protein [Myxococcales bacterium]
MTPSEFFAAFTWRDALDFGLLYAAFYTSLRLLRGTRAVPVLLAVAFFAAVSAAARALDLVAVAALLKYLLEYIIIILIVVFHQEIRRVLLRIGQQLLPQGRRQQARSAVSELVVAMERLQRARIGALIILEGEIDVLDVASNRGREIDASLLADTLVALMIPHPTNLAHDGAVLIRNLKIERAGVICPLSQSDDLDPRFGTRHRGAIGVSEETDALVLVVSEERGEMRVVYRGEISPSLTAAEVEARIGEWLEQPPLETAEEAAETRIAGRSRVDASAGSMIESRADLGRAPLLESRADLERPSAEGAK